MAAQRERVLRPRADAVLLAEQLGALAEADRPLVGHPGLTIRQPSVVEYIVALPAGNARSDFGRTYGARVIDSTPPATMIEASPTAIVRAAPTTASRPEAHSRLTVEPGTDVGRPAR